jgi:glycosyltransferase involved in cell wall biosynthesis
VLSRWNDPMPQVVFEAMASGCAVLASDRGGIPEACGDAAVLVDPDDFPAVVRALRSLVADAGTLNTYKQRALARAHEATWAKNAEAFERVLAC